MTSSSATIDLTACDREPVHIPGAIQPHGLRGLRPDSASSAWLARVRASSAAEPTRSDAEL